jgi:hypothetical protein
MRSPRICAYSFRSECALQVPGLVRVGAIRYVHSHEIHRNDRNIRSAASAATIRIDWPFFIRQVDPRLVCWTNMGKHGARRRMVNVGSDTLDPLERTVPKEPTEQVRNIRFDTPWSGQHTR